MNQSAWTVRVVSDLAGMSQVELVFDAAFDPPFYAFHGIHDVMFLPSDHANTYPRLPQLPPRMQGSSGRAAPPSEPAAVATRRDPGRSPLPGPSANRPGPPL